MENCKKQSSKSLLDVPPEILQHILSFCSYDEIAKQRQICRRFDDECRVVLNRGRNKLMKKYEMVFETEKAKMAPGKPIVENLGGKIKGLDQVKWYLNRLCEAYDRHLEPEDRRFVAGKVLDMLAEFVKRVPVTTDTYIVEGWHKLNHACQRAQEHFEDHILPLEINSEPSRFRFQLDQSSSMKKPNGQSTNCKSQLLNLPSEVRNRIISFLPYHDISNLRQVCQTLNIECQKTLNEGIVNVMEEVARRMKGLRTICPQDPGKRLFSTNGILLEAWEQLDTDLDRLYHSYASAHEHKRSCFIAGKVIDETNRFLLEVNSKNIFSKLSEMEATNRKLKKARQHFKYEILQVTKQHLL